MRARRCESRGSARLAKNGIDDAPQVEVPLPASLALGRRGLAELLAGGEFDVIVCSSDTLAQGAIMEAESRGCACRRIWR
jgi:LacI family gluconate utilization system Gnt-I transcriptional repressor